MEIADATATLIESDFSEGYEALAEVKAKHRDAPWYPSVRGNVTWYLLATEAETIRREAPGLVRGVPAHYDPMPVLETCSRRRPRHVRVRDRRRRQTRVHAPI